jgi:hypothetical protein
VCLDVIVDACKVCLIEHAEFNFLRGRGDDEVEGVAEDGRVRDAVDCGKVEEGERLLEAVEDSDRGEE